MTTIKQKESQFVLRVERQCKGLRYISSGVCKSCPECQSSYGIDGPDDPREIPDEGFCSSAGCDTCGAGLQQMLYDGHARMGRGRGTMIHLNMCEDCVMWFANGTEPGES